MYCSFGFFGISSVRVHVFKQMLEFFGVSQDELGCRDIAVGCIATMSADRSPIEVRSLCNKLFDI